MVERFSVDRGEMFLGIKIWWKDGSHYLHLHPDLYLHKVCPVSAAGAWYI